MTKLAKYLRKIPFPKQIFGKKNCPGYNGADMDTYDTLSTCAFRFIGFEFILQLPKA